MKEVSSDVLNQADPTNVSSVDRRRTRKEKR